MSDNQNPIEQEPGTTVFFDQNTDSEGEDLLQGEEIDLLKEE